jgi:hypothetical protein
MAGDPKHTTETEIGCTPEFAAYVDGLEDLLAAGQDHPRQVAVTAALDGQVGEQIRALIPLELRRSAGAFFTSQSLAARLLLPGDVAFNGPILDPACGAGDLLLRVAAQLPVRRTVTATLRSWGQKLHGRDIDPVFVRAARLRLALMACMRTGARWCASGDCITELLPEVRAGDGKELRPERPGLLLLNPPFGATVARTKWGQGLIGRAAVFATELIEQLPAGTAVRAILPDVLRSGSNYERWREHVETLMRVESIEAVGQFDPWTDIDVFILRGALGVGGNTVAWWPDSEDGARIVDRLFHVHVGAVVPHRDPDEGDESPFICARDLPVGGEHFPLRTRRHSGRRYCPPLVVVRRTSRPSDAGPRAIATVVRCRQPILVENHLLVCIPRDRRLATCYRLRDALMSQTATDWLDARIRCRHLTVSALRAVPLP